MEVENTERGFEIVRFQDLDGKQCSLQQSSLALYENPGSSAVRLGVGDQRMHLSRHQANEIVQHLIRWIDNESFKHVDEKSPQS